MNRPLLVLRPQPGNDATAARARALGLAVVQLPLFETVALARDAMPAGPFDALLLTSANGARFGADLLARFAALPVYAVGEATARAARERGARDVRLGGGDAASTAAQMAADGHRAVLHLCGAEVRPFELAGLAIERLAVYRSDALPDDMVRPALYAVGPAVVAIHSPRAGARFAALVSTGERGRFALAAISPAALAACDSGWAGGAASPTPDDTALLALAETLCRVAF